MKNKVLLITGGTGSFGNSVIDKFLSTDIKEIEFFLEMKKSKMTCVKNILNFQIN